MCWSTLWPYRAEGVSDTIMFSHGDEGSFTSTCIWNVALCICLHCPGLIWVFYYISNNKNTRDVLLGLQEASLGICELGCDRSSRKSPLSQHLFWWVPLFMLLLSWHLIHMYTRQLLLVFLKTCLQCKLFEVNNNLRNRLAFIYSNEAIMQFSWIPYIHAVFMNSLS